MIFFSILVGLIALLAFFLIIVVLLQSGKGGGLAGIASGGATRQVLGARQAPNVLERATWTIAALFIALCILTNFAIDRGDDGQPPSTLQDSAQPQQQSAPPPGGGGLDQQPGAPAGPQQQGGDGAESETP